MSKIGVVFRAFMEVKETAEPLPDEKLWGFIKATLPKTSLPMQPDTKTP